MADETFERPADFDLTGAWRQILVDVGGRGREIRATGMADRSILGPLRHVLGSRLSVGPWQPDRHGHQIEVEGRSVEVLAAQLAGFVAGIEIDEPQDLRVELARLGRLLLARYPVSAAGSEPGPVQ